MTQNIFILSHSPARDMSRRQRRLFAMLVTYGLSLVLAMINPPAHAAANLAPVAKAGSDQSIGTASQVQLSGLDSYDSDGGSIKSYRWTQLKGQKIKLSSGKIANPTFTTPSVLPSKESARTLIFKLVVSDNKNKKANDTVTVTLVSCTAPKILLNNSCQLPPPVCYPPKKWQNGLCLPPPPLTCKAPLVPIDGACRFAPVVCTLPEVEQNGVCALPIASTLINDTGVTLCSDNEINGDFCPISSNPGQDGDFGRDHLLNDDSDGRAGFSFSKLDADGNLLPNDASQWHCIKDNVSGLIWENKTADGSLHDQNRLFTHLATDGIQHDNDAAYYVASINTQGLCGATDWRLPSANELQGIVDYGISYPGPTIDSRFFPGTTNDKYWTSTSQNGDALQAWVVTFDDGRLFRDNRDQSFRVRLVRDGRVNPIQ